MEIDEISLSLHKALVWQAQERIYINLASLETGNEYDDSLSIYFKYHLWSILSTMCFRYSIYFVIKWNFAITTTWGTRRNNGRYGEVVVKRGSTVHVFSSKCISKHTVSFCQTRIRWHRYRDKLTPLHDRRLRLLVWVYLLTFHIKFKWSIKQTNSEFVYRPNYACMSLIHVT